MTTPTKTTWRKVKLGAVADVNAHSVNSNFPHKRIQYIDISAVGSGVLSSMTEYELGEAPGRARRLVMDGDTILSTVRPNRRSFLYIKNPRENTVASTGFAVISPKKEMDPRFLYYLVTRQQFSDYLSSNVKGSAYPAVSPEVITDAEILIPSSADQERIADVLSAFDDKIDVNNKISAALEQMAQTIFKEWFIEKSKFKVKSEKLEAVCDIVYGKDLPTRDLKKSGFPVYGGNGIIGHSDKYLFSEPQIIVGCRGAYSGNIFKTELKSFITHNSLILKIKKERDMGINYLFYALQKSNVKSSVTGSAQPQITIAELNQVSILISDENLMRRFEEIASVIENYKSKVTKENQKLAALRDLLLPKLMSGEIRV